MVPILNQSASCVGIVVEEGRVSKVYVWNGKESFARGKLVRDYFVEEDL